MLVSLTSYFFQCSTSKLRFFLEGLICLLGIFFIKIGPVDKGGENENDIAAFRENVPIHFNHISRLLIRFRMVLVKLHRCCKDKAKLRNDQLTCIVPKYVQYTQIHSTAMARTPFEP